MNASPGLNFIYAHLNRIIKANDLNMIYIAGPGHGGPALIATCVVGDGEAETGPLAAAWHSNKFLNPATDGAVLPILHLNGYKIANPTLPATIDQVVADIGGIQRAAREGGSVERPYGDTSPTDEELVA